MSDIQRTKYIYLKSEKLSFAIYKISDFISDTDPIKYKLRELSVSFLVTLGVLNGVMGSSKTLALNESVSFIQGIKSLLSLGHAEALVSEMNYSVLIREFEEIERQILLMLGHPDLDFKLNIEPPAPPRREVGESPKGSKQSLEAGGFRHKETARKLNQDRRRQIVEFLRTLGASGSSSIKEISIATPGCSEKTIQRELVFLVHQGEVTKTGERRWSRYALK